jgi:hypothetical protein
MMRSNLYLGSKEVDDGYNGSKAIVHLCAMPTGEVLAVTPHGYFVSHERWTPSTLEEVFTSDPFGLLD